VRQRWRRSAALSAVVVVVYFGFVLRVALLWPEPTAAAGYDAKERRMILGD
jgi:hypothetical protein